MGLGNINVRFTPVSSECDLAVTDRAKSENKQGGGGPKLRRFQSPCAVFT